jgi:DnaJ-domain-containing protein 1
MLVNADKILHPQEEFILKNVAVVLRISPSHYNMLLNEYFDRQEVNFNEKNWQSERINEDWFKEKWGSASSQRKSGGGKGWQANSQDWFKRQSQRQTENERYYRADPLKKYYDLLGCPVGCSEAELKKAYRKQALENHPDRLLSRGLPKQAMKLANDRFLEIKRAYEEICNKRGIK